MRLPLYLAITRNHRHRYQSPHCDFEKVALHQPSQLSPQLQASPTASMLHVRTLSQVLRRRPRTGNASIQVAIYKAHVSCAAAETAMLIPIRDWFSNPLSSPSCSIKPTLRGDPSKLTRQSTFGLNLVAIAFMLGLKVEVLVRRAQEHLTARQYALALHNCQAATSFL